MSGGDSRAPDLVPPAFCAIPPRAGSLGDVVCEFAREIGIALDPEQELMLDAICSVDDEGRWATIDSAIVCPRQNGKTLVLIMLALADLFLFDARLVIWSAHQFPTARQAFRDMTSIIMATPWLRRELVPNGVHMANGEVGFELRRDRRLEFRARSKSAGRGLTGDRVILDEAFELDANEIGALYPTLSARPNPSVVYASSAGMIDSDVLRSLRDRGRAGDPHLTWVEWCAPPRECATPQCDHRPGIGGCVLDDVELLRAANFAYGRRVTERYVASERRSLPPTEFMRERLGWWDEPVIGSSSIPLDAWEECAAPDAEVLEPCALAVDVSPGHTSGAIVACGGVIYVAEHHRGTGWIVERLIQLVAQHEVSAIGLDPAGPAAALIPELEHAGFAVRNALHHDGMLVLLDGREMMRASEALLAGVLDGSVTHRAQHALDMAVRGAGRRQVGDSWRWSRRDSTADISPLVAATIARYLWHQPVAAAMDVAASIW